MQELEVLQQLGPGDARILVFLLALNNLYRKKMGISTVLGLWFWEASGVGGSGPGLVRSSQVQPNKNLSKP
jgi:hypothetical protein